MDGGTSHIGKLGKPAPIGMFVVVVVAFLGAVALAVAATFVWLLLLNRRAAKR